jgi:hypothetical protein
MANRILLQTNDYIYFTINDSTIVRGNSNKGEGENFVELKLHAVKSWDRGSRGIERHLHEIIYDFKI